MRILIAPNPDNIPLHIWPACGGRHEVLQLANRDASPSDRWPANSWRDLLSRCQYGWTPDVYICWSFEYRPVPEGIEDANCHTVGVVGDWNLGGQAIRHIAGVFDLLVADQNGCDRLRAAGYENVLYWPLWGYDPLRHYVIPGVERDLDVVMVGNFNHHVQRERAPWLARVARMSRNHRVLVASGIYGEEYTRTLNRARIVFNRSIRGELNMRAYEAAACGALMFYERENREIASLFRDREECVLYGEDDLEDLVTYYLQHEGERQRIAEAGRKRVAACTYSEQAAGLFDEIEALRSKQLFPHRSFAFLSRNEKELRRVRQWLTVPPSASLERAEILLDGVDDSDTEPAERYMARACALGFRAQKICDAKEAQSLYLEAVALCRWHQKLVPGCAVAFVNAGELLLAMGDFSGARSDFLRAAKLLQMPQLLRGDVEGPYFPRSFDTYTVEMERHWTQTHVGSDQWRREIGDLLLWRCHTRLAEIALRHDDVDAAVEHGRSAASLRPEIGPSWSLLGRCHRAAGELAEAATAFKRAYELVPMETEVWKDLLDTLFGLGAEPELCALADDMIAVIDGCPNVAQMRPVVERYAGSPRAASSRLTLLAVPDWRRPESWQPLVADFARLFRCESEATLALLVDPRSEPDLESILYSIQKYLEDSERIAEFEWPVFHVIHKSQDSLDLLEGTHWIDAVCPPGCGPPSDWMPAIPRMTVRTFHLAFLAGRPIPFLKAA